jgi:hypothetical protein
MHRATLALTVACLLLQPSPAKGAKVLKATRDTVHWGFFSKDLPAKLEIESGQITNTIARNPEGPHGLTV